MRVLVLSGGGSRGAYQVGALQYILGEHKINYDAFCGISVGALNCAFLSMFSEGQEELSSIELTKLWQRVNTNKIYKRWFPFGKLHGLWLSSLYNSKPLSSWIENELDINKILSSNKKVVVGATSLTTGKYKTFNQTYPNFTNAVIASSSYPGMFTPIKLEEELWSDGGIKEITPLQAAIDLGATEIDVIITSPDNDTKPFPNNPNVIDILTRAVDLMSDEIIMNDLQKSILYNKLIISGIAPDKRIIKYNIIRPKSNLIDNSLDFDQNKIIKMSEQGYLDAKCMFVK